MNNDGCGDPDTSKEKLAYECTDITGDDDSINCLNYKSDNTNVFTSEDINGSKTFNFQDNDSNTISLSRNKYKKIVIKCKDNNKSTKSNFNWCEWSDPDIEGSCVHKPGVLYNDSNDLGQICSEDGTGFVNKVISCNGNNENACDINSKPVLDEVCYLPGGVCGINCTYKNESSSSGPYTTTKDSTDSDFNNIKNEFCKGGFNYKTRVRNSRNLVGRDNKYPDNLPNKPGQIITNGDGSVCESPSKFIFIKR